MKLYEIAKILRSKNSGPFCVTLDVFFYTNNDYNSIKNNDVITRKTIADAYGLPIENVSEPMYYDQAMGIKITYDRVISSGTVGDRDVYGAQQHAPLMNLTINKDY